MIDPVIEAFTRSQRQRADDQLRRVAEGRVQEAANAGTEPVGEFLGRLADEAGQRHDGQRRGDENSGVALRREKLEDERHGREDEQQPERVAAKKLHARC
jgi:cell wall assembly regulator SMI1